MNRQRKLKLSRNNSAPLSVQSDKNDTNWWNAIRGIQNKSFSTDGTKSCSLTPSAMSHKTLSTKASNSEMSFGSANLQDSFVAISKTGFSSMCISDNSCLQTKKTSRRHPRLIRSARTKALFDELDGFDSDGNADVRKSSPRSNCTLETLPCTPLAQDIEDDEPDFPESTTTPQIHVSSSRSTLLASPLITNNHSSTSSSFNSRHEETQMARAQRKKLAGIAENEYWKSCIKSDISTYGAKSVRVAQGFCNIGNAFLTCKEYAESLSAYKKAVRILREIRGDDSLHVACALDKVGYAASMNPTIKNLNWALIALHESLIIRHAHLGPHHCDVVDTLNKIAGIHLHKRDWEKARDAYVEVLTVRAAIFGRNHPSVAVTAQTLGRVYTSLSEFELALKHMELALELFRGEPMSMQDNHPLVVKLLKNVATTSRLMTSLGRNQINT